ncbi:unnamed protein product [Closterium sp. NIES-65]|nr:unnamed protein product [Closterium sp. NIES-65]CAI6008226.1 unnamed protein product [Closterium sp. NIES-65]
MQPRRRYEAVHTQGERPVSPNHVPSPPSLYSPPFPLPIPRAAMLAVKKEGLKLSTLKAEDQEALATSQDLVPSFLIPLSSLPAAMLAVKKEGLKLSTLKAEDQEAPAISESFEVDADSTAPHAAIPASTLVPFPLLLSAEAYTPWTIPFRSAKDPPGQLTDTETTWIDVFRRSIEPFGKRAAGDESVENAAEKAKVFEEKYTAILDDFAKDPSSHGGPPNPNLCRLREVCLTEAGFNDIFKKTKAEENEKALAMLPATLKRIDAVEDLKERIEVLVKGVLAGNIFDLGANNSAALVEGEGLSFEKSFEQLLPRPWVFDHVAEFQKAWLDRTWKKVVVFYDNSGADLVLELVVVFCDNSGADLVLGVLPLVRELVRQGAQVVVAANDMPSINDVTYNELLSLVQKLVRELVRQGAQVVVAANDMPSINNVTYNELLSLVQKVQVTVEDETISAGIDSGRILIVNSGSDVPVADLAHISPELAFAAEDAELVIMEGMGRAIETNLHALLTCDKLNIGMVKHKEVADFLGGRIYDCVVKYTPGDYVPTPSRAPKVPTHLSSA